MRTRRTAYARQSVSRGALLFLALAVVVGAAAPTYAASSAPAAAARPAPVPAATPPATQNPTGKLLGAVESQPSAMLDAAQSAPRAVSALTYHGGPVQHSSAVYVIFWTPAAYQLPDGYEATISQYFTDVAHDSYLASNEYGVATQYYDGTGSAKKFVSYNIAFKAAIVDTHAYPKSGCPNYTIGDGTKSAVCLSDTQIQKEIKSIIAAHHFPTGLSSQYFLFTPQGVASCYASTATAAGQCYNPLTVNGYCSYHSHVGPAAAALLYANMPYAALNGCLTGQSPNGNAADSVLNNVVHEQTQTMTDPLGTAWYNAAGQEIADPCHLTFGSPLGATATGQYNEDINGHGYWLQQIWSNRAHACVQRNLFPQPAVSFSFKPAIPEPGKKVTFTSSAHETGATALTYHWTFPDGSASTAKNPTHKFATTVIFGNVTLIVSDAHGDQTRIVNTITVVK